MSHRRYALLAFLGVLAACQSATAPSLTELQRQQDVWASHHLERYAYQYETAGFSIVWDGRAIRLVVLHDTVRSAQYAGTADSVPVAPATLPTIDALFAIARTALQDGHLVGAQFDATFGYPTRIEVSGPPDASGVIRASQVELLP
jgi:Family of unknown function (DUF6174)